MAERTMLEYNVVPLRLIGSSAGHAGLVEKLMVKMAIDGWAFVSLATPTTSMALVVFSRPVQKG